MAFTSSESVAEVARSLGWDEQKTIGRMHAVVAGGDTRDLETHFNMSSEEIRERAQGLLDTTENEGLNTNPFLSGMSEEFEALPEPAPTPDSGDADPAISAPVPADSETDYGIDRETYADGTPRHFTPTPLEAPDLLTKVGELSEELLTGEIPASVLAALERDTAEQAIQGGLSGQIGRNLVSRDLGLTSLDLQTRGATLAAGVAEAQLRIDQFNEEQTLRVAAYNQELVEWEDKYAAMVAETEVNQKEVQLAALTLESVMRQFRIGTEVALMTANSTREIAGAQSLLDDLPDYFTDITAEIDRILAPFRG